MSVNGHEVDINDGLIGNSVQITAVVLVCIGGNAEDIGETRVC